MPESRLERLDVRVTAGLRGLWTAQNVWIPFRLLLFLPVLIGWVFYEAAGRPDWMTSDTFALATGVPYTLIGLGVFLHVARQAEQEYLDREPSERDHWGPVDTYVSLMFAVLAGVPLVTWILTGNGTVAAIVGVGFPCVSFFLLVVFVVIRGIRRIKPAPANLQDPTPNKPT